jgi:hypothetical protein
MNSDEQVTEIFEFDPDRVQRYKIILRRNRLFGFWVGEQLGKVDCEMLDYMARVVQSDLEEPGDLDVLRKVYVDLLAAGKKVNAADLRAKLHELHEQARQEIESLSGSQDIEFQAKLAYPSFCLSLTICAGGPGTGIVRRDGQASWVLPAHCCPARARARGPS